MVKTHLTSYEEVTANTSITIIRIKSFPSLLQRNQFMTSFCRIHNCQRRVCTGNIINSISWIVYSWKGKLWLRSEYTFFMFHKSLFIFEWQSCVPWHRSLHCSSLECFKDLCCRTKFMIAIAVCIYVYSVVLILDFSMAFFFLIDTVCIKSTQEWDSNY